MMPENVQIPIKSLISNYTLHTISKYIANHLSLLNMYARISSRLYAFGSKNYLIQLPQFKLMW